MYGIEITVDDSDVKAKLDFMKRNLKPERFERAMYRIYSRTGKHVRQIVKTDVPKQYVIGAQKVGKAVQDAKVSGMSCIIPIRDKRGNIGSQYGAAGGAHGWASLHRKYKVKARIVKGGQSILPSDMRSYGGQPPFRNLGSKLGGLTFTRAGKARVPIMKVSGIAIPQMPMNRSRADVENDIMNWMKKQVEREFLNVINGR